MKRLRAQARMENLPALLDLVVGCATAEGLSIERTTELELAVEEALVNIFNYAYPGGAGDVEVSCFRDEPAGRLVVEIADHGAPFDPLGAPPPDLASRLDARRVGGLGIFLIREISDDVRYSREDDRNVLRLYMELDNK